MHRSTHLPRGQQHEHADVVRQSHQGAEIIGEAIVAQAHEIEGLQRRKDVLGRIDGD